MKRIKCAEAVVDVYEDFVSKRRVPKNYRVKELDVKTRRERTRKEAKIISEARRCGVPTPIIHNISSYGIRMERIKGKQLRDILDDKLCERVGETVGKLHTGGIIHGDLTTSNMILSDSDRVYLIDFGLSYFDQSVEARGVDVHVLFQTLKGMYDDEGLIEAFKRGYKRVFNGAEEVLRRTEEIEKRGRYL